ncbi:MAG: hypothetical protein PUB96_07290 [Helicobacteraceae bacterium]|nr:hypothetical protein [Helicobacteraceae bacterium]
MKLQYLRGGGHLVVGISIYGLGNEKHMGVVDYELFKLGVKVVYLNNTGQKIKRTFNKEQAVEVPLPMDYYKYIDFIKYIFSTASTYSRNDKQVFFVHHHSYSGLLESSADGVLEYIKNIYNKNIDYLFLANKKCTKASIEILKEIENPPILLESGYAAFDVENTLEECARDSVLVALHDFWEFLEIKEAVVELLEKGINIVVRYRFGWGEAFLKEHILPLEIYKNCKIIKDNDGYKEAVQRSFTLITSASSLAYTFPLKTLCPAILYFKDKEKFKRNICGIYFYDDNLHLKASNSKEIVESILKIKEQNKSLWSDRILKHRQNEVFNYKKASIYMAQKMVEIIKEYNDIK